ncbi:hypothetical protein CPB85DRAFT_1254225 [Mucidula mucida]|nr:hypothetical protein CPB85DRAFT_1254225 [Mucidula mucida]
MVKKLSVDATLTEYRSLGEPQSAWPRWSFSLQLKSSRGTALFAIDRKQRRTPISSSVRTNTTLCNQVLADSLALRPIPVGLRNHSGNIEPIPADIMQVDGAVYGGATPAVPTCLNETMFKKAIDAPMSFATQDAAYTPIPTNRYTGHVNSLSQTREFSFELGTPYPATHRRAEIGDIDSHRLRDLVLSNDAVEDTIMLDTETQVMNHSLSLPPSSVEKTARFQILKAQKPRFVLGAPSGSQPSRPEVLNDFGNPQLSWWIAKSQRKCV